MYVPDLSEGVQFRVQDLLQSLPQAQRPNTADRERQTHENCEYVTPYGYRIFTSGEIEHPDSDGECAQLGTVNIVFEGEHGVACPIHALPMLAWMLEQATPNSHSRIAPAGPLAH